MFKLERSRDGFLFTGKTLETFKVIEDGEKREKGSSSGFYNKLDTLKGIGLGIFTI